LTFLPFKLTLLSSYVPQFDKDDDLAVEFVAAAANLRAAAYDIPPQSLFEAKGMAGNIIHAIATTNAIISGLIVVEATKLLATGGDPAPCRSTFLRQDPSNRKLAVPVALEPPNPRCVVCGTARLRLRIDTAAATLSDFVERILRGHLGLVEPSLMYGTATSMFQYEEGEDLDEDEVEENARHLPTALATLPAGGVCHGTVVEVGDQKQQLKLQVTVVHEEAWDEETHPHRYAVEGEVPVAKEEDATAAAAAAAAAAVEEKEKGVKRKAAVAVEDEDGAFVVVDSEDEGPAGGAGAGGKRKRGGDRDGEGAKRAKMNGGGAEDSDDDEIVILD
jgi:ubiquitin-like 1-activating enzyme E1 B